MVLSKMAKLFRFVKEHYYCKKNSLYLLNADTGCFCVHYLGILYKMALSFAKG